VGSIYTHHLGSTFFELFINVVIVPYARNNKQQTSKAKETEEEVPPVNSE